MAPERLPVSRCREGGFNLIEVLFVVGIFVVIGGALLTVLMSSQTSYLAADVHLQVQEEARKALDQAGRELREAVRLSCDENAGPVASCGPSSRLNFQVVRYDAGGTFTPGSEVADGEFIHYRLFNGQLVRYRTGAATTLNSGLTECTAAADCRVVAQNVQTALFRWDNASGERTVTVQVETFIRNQRLPGTSPQTEGIRSGLLTVQVQVRHPDPDNPT